MRLDELIGARLAVGLPGSEATDEVLRRIRRIRPQSLIVFSRNFASHDQFTRLVRRLEEALGFRLLVLVDHEGGRIWRFGRETVTQFPEALTVGARGRPEEAERQGAVEAEELARLSIRVNLAPCVDVLVDGSDPIIGNRSYGSDPACVAAFAVARIRGLQTHGVAACAKHFPGLGAVPRDPHKVLPTIGLDWPAMERVHLVPFRAAIDAGVALVMSSHVCYPGLGEPPELPATFSPRLIRQLLRDRLGFSGVIVSDDLEMGALRAFGSLGEAAILATEAGHDLLLICSDLAGAEKAAGTLQRAYESNILNRKELEASVERLLKLRKTFLPGSLVYSG